MELVISGIVGLVTGAAGSLIAPWAQWAVEKRRNRFSYQRELVASWRDAIERFDWPAGSFGDTAAYSSLRPHMRPETVQRLESRTAFVPADGRGELGEKHVLLDEVAHIEKEWRLV